MSPFVVVGGARRCWTSGMVAPGRLLLLLLPLVFTLAGTRVPLAPTMPGTVPRTAPGTVPGGLALAVAPA